MKGINVKTVGSVKECLAEVDSVQNSVHRPRAIIANPEKPRNRRIISKPLSSGPFGFLECLLFWGMLGPAGRSIYGATGKES